MQFMFDQQCMMQKGLLNQLAWSQKVKMEVKAAAAKVKTWSSKVATNLGSYCSLLSMSKNYLITLQLKTVAGGQFTLQFII